MLIEDLVPNINLEDYDVEFKGILEEGGADRNHGIPHEIGWLKEIAAFSNTHGGTLYVGVDNRSHQILALDHKTVDHLGLLVDRQAKAHLEPPVSLSFEPLPVPQTKPIRYVLAVHVTQSRMLPVTLHYKGLGVIYVRHFGKTSVATAEEIREMVLSSEAVSYDKLVSNVRYRKEDFTKLFGFYAKQNPTAQLTEKTLFSIGFMTPDGYLKKGALLFKDDCQEERTLMVLSRIPGISKGEQAFSATEEYRGNLIDELLHAEAFVRSASANGYIKTDTGRESYVSFPGRSLREALANALGHRNYFIQGSQIEVNLFKDRLEIISPGSLPSGKYLKEEKNISAIVPLRRNELICDVFTLLKVMEKRGSGFDKISEDYKPYGEVFAPYVSADSSSFSITLPDVTHPGGVVSKMDSVSLHPVGELKEAHATEILSFCYNQERTNKEIADMLHLRPSTYLNKKVLLPLVEKGYLLEQKDRYPTRYRTVSSKVILD